MTDIIITNQAQLRAKCEPVANDEVEALRKRLENALSASPIAGIGLAAPQINVHRRMAIVRIPGGHSVDLVNCRIAERHDKKLIDYEGCLSFPGRFEKTLRYNEIHVVDNMVEPYSFICTGLLAVAIQHELDHLDGILLPDVALPKAETKQKSKPNDRCPCGSGKKYKKCCAK